MGIFCIAFYFLLYWEVPSALKIETGFLDFIIDSLDACLLQMDGGDFVRAWWIPRWYHQRNAVWSQRLWYQRRPHAHKNDLFWNCMSCSIDLPIYPEQTHMQFIYTINSWVVRTHSPRDINEVHAYRETWSWTSPKQVPIQKWFSYFDEPRNVTKRISLQSN